MNHPSFLFNASQVAIFWWGDEFRSWRRTHKSSNHRFDKKLENIPLEK